MDEVKEYVMAGAIGVVAFFSKWWFNKTESKIEAMEQRIARNETNIQLNTQSDKDYRENTAQILAEIKAQQNEIYKLLINK